MTTNTTPAKITPARTRKIDAAPETAKTARAGLVASRKKAVAAAEKPATTTTVTAKAAPAKRAPAAKAAPVKVAPATVKEMTREQKRAVASALIDAAGDLLGGWDKVAAGVADLEGVNAKVAGELIGTWLSYCPGTAWNTHLGVRPRSSAK